MKFLLTVIFLLSSCLSQAQSLDWKHYPYQAQNTTISFPKDEGAHPWIPGLEWWYVVIHAKGEITGDDYSILVTHFNNLFRFFTVTNTTKKTHESSTVMGVLNAKMGHLELTQNTSYGTDYMRTTGSGNGQQDQLDAFEYDFLTHGKEMNLQGHLSSQKKPLMVDEDGLTWVGTSGLSWYYSQTQMHMEGVLNYKGVTEPISGKAWMDHQWGPFLIAPVEAFRLFQTYEWFCVQLDNGAELMISNIFDRQYNRPKDFKHGGVEYYSPNEENLLTQEVEFTRTHYWKDPESGHVMSMGWNLNVPEWNLNLQMKPIFENQMVKFPMNGDFWEGSIAVAGTINGVKVTGKAYGELVHRYEKPEVKWGKLPAKTIRTASLDLSWELKNHDAGNPLGYDLSLVVDGKSTALIANLKDTHYTLNLNDFKILREGSSFQLVLKAHSVDGTLSADVPSDVIKLNP